MKNRAFLISLVVIVCAALLGCDMPVLNNNLREPEFTLDPTVIPEEVRNLGAAAGAGTVRLTWTNPTDASFDHTEISYSADSGLITILPPVDKTLQTKIIESLKYGTIYSFTVKAVDTSGNKSHGALVIASLANVVNDLALDAYITAPVENSAPDKRPITTVQYTGTQVWGTTTIGTIGSTFVQGHTYAVTATLQANEGYTFTGLTKDDFSYSGATIFSVTVRDAGKNVTVRIDFPPAIPGWYVSQYGNNTDRDGKTLEESLATVARALELIFIDHTNGTPLTSAAIVIEGNLPNSSITIDNTYPPIVLRGLGVANPGVMSASTGSPVLTLGTGAQVSLEANLTLTGANVTVNGGGVQISTADPTKPATFTMKGGIITGNTATVYGGGVYAGDNCFFFMSGGTISDNTAERGGGVVVHKAAFTMNSGTISDNKVSIAAGGVYVLTEGVFTMSGGTITRNTGTTSVSFAGGVYVAGTSTFTLGGGIISNNESDTNGGGVYVNSTSVMIMNGGTIRHNKTASGGGVIVAAAASLEMNGGTISDNEAAYGGGVCTFDTAHFMMKGGTILGNTATEHGGGVDVRSNGIFIKEPLSDGASSGIIYGYDPNDPNSNKVHTGTSFEILDNMGHAVYIAAGPKTRETTVMSDQHLDSAVADADGGWAE